MSHIDDNKVFLDEVLSLPGQKSPPIKVVSIFSVALARARASDFVASAPEQHVGNLCDGMFCFSIRLTTQEIMVSILWHPRTDAAPAHHWSRKCILKIGA